MYRVIYKTNGVKYSLAYTDDREIDAYLKFAKLLMEKVEGVKYAKEVKMFRNGTDITTEATRFLLLTHNII